MEKIGGAGALPVCADSNILFGEGRMHCTKHLKV